jgi:hypothetical protein
LVADVKCLHVPNVHSLETLHNALSFKQLDNFMKSMTETPGSRHVSTVSSPSRTPEQPIFGSQSESEGRSNRLLVHQESVFTDFLSSGPSRSESAVTSPAGEGRFFVASLPAEKLDTSISLALDDKENFSSLQTPDEARKSAGSLSSSPIIESLISSPIKEMRGDGDHGRVDMGVVKTLTFDFDENPPSDLA